MKKKKKYLKQEEERECDICTIAVEARHDTTEDILVTRDRTRKLFWSGREILSKSQRYNIILFNHKKGTPS